MRRSHEKNAMTWCGVCPELAFFRRFFFRCPGLRGARSPPRRPRRGSRPLRLWVQRVLHGRRARGRHRNLPQRAGGSAVAGARLLLLGELIATVALRAVSCFSDPGCVCCVCVSIGRADRLTNEKMPKISVRPTTASASDGVVVLVLLFLRLGCEQYRYGREGGGAVFEGGLTVGVVCFSAMTTCSEAEGAHDKDWLLRITYVMRSFHSCHFCRQEPVVSPSPVTSRWQRPRKY